MSELRPIGTEFDELGGRFRVTGHRSRPDGDPVEEVECLRPVPFHRHKSGRRQFKPPKLDMTLPGLPPEVLAAFAEIQAAAPPKSPQQPKAAPKPKRPTYHRYRAPRRIGIPPPKPPPEDPWPFIIIVAAVIVFLILSDAWERSRPLRFPIPNSGHVTHRRHDMYRETVKENTRRALEWRRKNGMAVSQTGFARLIVVRDRAGCAKPRQQFDKHAGDVKLVEWDSQQLAYIGEIAERLGRGEDVAHVAADFWARGLLDHRGLPWGQVQSKPGKGTGNPYEWYRRAARWFHRAKHNGELPPAYGELAPGNPGAAGLHHRQAAEEEAHAHSAAGRYRAHGLDRGRLVAVVRQPERQRP